jgi:hypothetical protein
MRAPQRHLRPCTAPAGNPPPRGSKGPRETRIWRRRSRCRSRSSARWRRNPPGHRKAGAEYADGSITTVRSPTTDVFCSGHAFLGDGRLLVGGGIEEWGHEPDPDHPHGGNFGGQRACWIYETNVRGWSRAADMNFQPGRATGGGRWYPTLITLASGRVLAVFGHPSQSDFRHRNNTPEIYNPRSNA